MALPKLKVEASFRIKIHLTRFLPFFMTLFKILHSNKRKDTKQDLKDISPMLLNMAKDIKVLGEEPLQMSLSPEDIVSKGLNQIG